jgi:hypothetical protein
MKQGIDCTDTLGHYDIENKRGGSLSVADT